MLLAFTTSALAIDAREVIIDRQADLAISPEHMGHVLASPNRNFAVPYAANPQSWWVFEKPHKKAAWADRSYLNDPSNARVLRTYFGFDKGEPLDASAVLSIIDVAKEVPMHYLLVGHADEVGSDAYNMQLSIRRASNMRSTLIERGVPESAIRVIGKGNHVLANLRDQSLNRRVEVLVRGDEKQRTKFAKAVKEETRRALQEKREQDARERARQVQAAVQANEQTAIYMQQHGSGQLSPTTQPTPAAGMTATQKALLPPVRLDQMGGGNPLEPVKNHEATK